MDRHEFKRARAILGVRWIGRRLTATEMATALGLHGKRRGEAVLAYEDGARDLSGPIKRLTEAMVIGGYVPPEFRLGALLGHPADAV